VFVDSLLFIFIASGWCVADVHFFFVFTSLLVFIVYGWFVVDVRCFLGGLLTSFIVVGCVVFVEAQCCERICFPFFWGMSIVFERFAVEFHSLLMVICWFLLLLDS